MKIFLLFVMLSSFCYAESLIQPLEPVKNINFEKAKLGKLLFFDPTLSKDETISCASCHKSEHGWADDTAVSTGVYGRKGRLNSPTILNSVYSFKQFWNGRVGTLKEQAKGPIHNSFEMDMTAETIENRLNKNEMYLSSFKKVYHKNKINFNDVLESIAEYEKTLTTEDAKFDLYLKGKLSLTEKEEEGYTLFRTYGCITCHNGSNIGANSFQKIGIVIPYRNCYSDRYEITKREFDKCVYKVPTLRNISKTSPYFHDGSAQTLKEAIKTMAYYNLGFELENDDVDKIEAFLKTLDGNLKEMNDD
jgi:cytochrome c peroxidase